jgi:hypothetical protein
MELGVAVEDGAIPEGFRGFFRLQAMAGAGYAPAMLILAIGAIGGVLSNFLLGAIVLAVVDRHGEVFDWYGWQPSRLGLLVALFFWPRMVIKSWRA